MIWSYEREDLRCRVKEDKELGKERLMPTYMTEQNLAHLFPVPIRSWDVLQNVREGIQI